MYANVLGRPVLVPSSKVTGIGSAIFAFQAAGTFSTIEEAQKKVCPSHTIFVPQISQRESYNRLYGLYRQVYFGFGQSAPGNEFGNILPDLIGIARQNRAK